MMLGIILTLNTFFAARFSCMLVSDVIIYESFSDNFVVNSGRWQGFICKQFLHAQCVRVKGDYLRLINKSDSVSLFLCCDACKIFLSQKIIDNSSVKNEFISKT